MKYLDFLKLYYYFGERLALEYLQKKVHIYLLGSGKFTREFLGANRYLNPKGIIVNPEVCPDKCLYNYKTLPVNSLAKLETNSIILITTTDQRLKEECFKNWSYSRYLDIPLMSPRCVNLQLTKKQIDMLEKRLELVKLGPQRQKYDFGMTHRYILPGNIDNLSIFIEDKLNGRSLIGNLELEIKEPVSIIIRNNVGLFNELPVFTRTFIAELIKFPLDYSEHLTLYEHLIWRRDLKISSVDGSHEFPGVVRTRDCRFLIKNAGEFIEFFTNISWGLPIDLIRKWTVFNRLTALEDQLQLKIFSQNNLGVFVFRSWFKTQPICFAEVISKIKESDVRQINFRELGEHELEIFQSQVRGGFWEDHGENGGYPFAICSFYYDLPFNPQMLKEEIRLLCSNAVSQVTNPIHSSDDNVESQYYLNILQGNGDLCT